MEAKVPDRLGFCCCDGPIECAGCGGQVCNKGADIGQVRDEGNDIAKNIERLQDLATGLLESVDLVDVRRVLSRICVSYSYLGERTQNELSKLNHKGEMVGSICQKLVQAEEIDPLLQLPELLSLQCDAVSRYKEALLELVPRLPHSIECSSPHGTLVPYASGGVFRFYSTVHISPAGSPAGSPTSSIHSLQLTLPLDVEQ